MRWCHLMLNVAAFYIILGQLPIKNVQIIENDNVKKLIYKYDNADQILY